MRLFSPNQGYGGTSATCQQDVCFHRENAVRTGLSPHPTNISDTARDRTVIRGGADKTGPRRLPCTVCRASGLGHMQSQNPRVFLGRGWAGRLERPGQCVSPEQSRGEERKCREWALGSAGGSPPAPPSCPPSSRTVISRCEHACTPTPGEGAATGSRQNTLGARSG